MRGLRIVILLLLVAGIGPRTIQAQQAFRDTATAHQMLAEAKQAHLERQLGEAIILARGSQRIYESYGDKYLQAILKAMQQTVSAQVGLRRYKDAQSVVDSILLLANRYEGGDKELIMGRTKLNQAVCLIEGGKYEEALDAIYASRKLLQNDSVALAQNEPRLLSEIGIVKRRQHKSSEAINYYTKAIDLYAQQGDTIGLSKCHHNLGNAYFDLYNLIGARHHYQKALGLYPPRYTLNRALSHEGVALTYRKVSAYAYANDNLLESYRMYKEKFGDTHRATRRIERKIAHNYLREGEIDRAIDMLRNPGKNCDGAYVATLAEAYLRNDQLDSALILSNYILSSPSAKHLDSLAILPIQAQVYEKQKDFIRAKRFLKKAHEYNIKILRKRDDRIRTSLINYVSLDGKAGNYQRAINALDTILATADNMKFHIPGSDSVQSHVWFSAMENKLDFYYQLYLNAEDESAKEDIKSNIILQGNEYLRALSGVRENVTSIQRSFSLKEGPRAVVRIILSVLYASVDEEDNIWQFARIQDEMRDILWYDFIKNASVVGMSAIESNRLSTESNVRKRIAELELFQKLHVDSAAISEEIVALKNKVAEKPTSSKLKINMPDDARVEKIIFEENDAMLSYFISGDYLYRLYIAEDARHVDTLYWCGKKEILIDSLVATLADPSSTSWSDLAKSLSDYLLQGLDMARHRRLLIFPDQALWLIPFEVLPIDEDGTLMIDRHTLTYSSSLKKYIHGKEFRADNETNKYDVIGFVPNYDKAASQDRNVLRSDKLVALPSAIKEMEAIASTLESSRAFLGQEATVESFIKALGQSQILHLPMHAFANHNQPELSHLVFSSTDTTNPLNRYLFASEIAMQRIPQELVVLSACNTGRGKFVKGEGVQSLARSFEYAGVRSSIFSLWRIPDAASSEVMTNFYENLTDDYTKSEALRLAKLAYRDHHRNTQFDHPFYWSGFVFSGNPAAMELSTGYSFVKLVGLVLCSIFILIFVSASKIFKRRFR